MMWNLTSAIPVKFSSYQAIRLSVVELSGQLIAGVMWVINSPVLISVSELLSINYRNTPVVLIVPACDFVFHAPVFASRLLCLLGSSALLLIPLDFHIPVLFYPVGNVISTPVSPLLKLVARVSPILVFSPVLKLMIKLRHKMVLCQPSIFTSPGCPVALTYSWEK